MTHSSRFNVFATALVDAEAETVVTEVLGHVKVAMDEEGHAPPLSAVIDGSYALANAVEATWTGIKVRMCLFHMIKATREYAHKQGVSADEIASYHPYLHRMARARRRDSLS